MILTILATAVVTGAALSAAAYYGPSVADALKDDHSVSDITGGLKRIETQLLVAFSHHENVADSHAADAAASLQAAADAREEASRAARVADKVTALLA